MLSVLRKNAGSWMIKVILGAIVVVFVFWGVGNYGNPNNPEIASVNGEPITVEAYRESYNQLMEETRQRFGQQINDEMLKMFGLERKALDRLIDKTLWRQEAARLDFSVTDEEFGNFVVGIPAFQVNGVFNERRYTSVLLNNRLTPETFGVMQKEQMLLSKLRAFILGGVKVSEQEAREWYNWQDASMMIDFVLFDMEKYTDISPTEEEVKKFYDDKQDQYQTKPMVKVRYFHFNPESYKASVKIIDEEITDYYQSRPDEFKTPKTVEARHILFKLDQQAGAELVESRRAEALETLKRARAEEDFAELAKEFSEGPSAKNGGFLGPFEKGAMVKPFSDKAFSMNVGEISEPVRTRFGWHIIKVEKINEDRTLSIEESTDRIRASLTEEKAKSLAYDDAEAMYDVTFDDQDISGIESGPDVEVRTTDFFDAGGPKEGVVNAPGFASAAFDLDILNVSSIQDLGDGYYIIQPIEKVPAGVADFADVKEKAQVELVEKIKDEQAKTEAEAFLSDLKNDKSLEEATERFGVVVKSSEWFKRNDSIPNLGSEPRIAQAAFALSPDKPLPENVLKGRKGYYVIRYKERKDADAGEFEKGMASIKDNLLRQKQTHTMNAWLETIRKGSEVTIKEGFLE
ncbi:MAG: hypothetical protein GY859_14765 [Desulfobacterales bacterium]|nr:hypothetical protein [Desulfobacterales bacterium]